MEIYDTHVHTCETSACGVLTAAETVALYRQAGYQGICVTDHYTRDFFAALEGSWQQKVERYLKGYRAACAAAEGTGLSVLLGAEIRIDGAPNDYLVFGLTEAFLNQNPELYAYDLQSLSALLRGAGMLLVQAHPFRPSMTVEAPALLDGVEVFNGNPRHNSHNDMARAFAQNHGLLMTSGSDCHEITDVAQGGIGLCAPAADASALAAALRAGGYTLLPKEK